MKVVFEHIYERGKRAMKYLRPRITELEHGAMTQALEHTIPLPHVDNGILARVPGEYVGQAQLALPDAALVPDDEISVEVNAAWLGRVRLTFRKYRYTRPKGKFSAVAWSCRHAEAIAPAGRS